MKILYRCKLCGCVDDGLSIGANDYVAMALVSQEILAGSHRDLRRERIHACEGKNYGVAELIGVVPDEMEATTRIASAQQVVREMLDRRAELLAAPVVDRKAVAAIDAQLEGFPTFLNPVDQQALEMVREAARIVKARPSRAECEKLAVRLEDLGNIRHRVSAEDCQVIRDAVELLRRMA